MANFVKIYFFFEVVINLDKEDLIRAALFLWMTFFLAARSAREEATLMLSAFLVFFACRIATSSLLIIDVLTRAFLLDDLNALFAVTVTGMSQV